jgi:hypothetical protein
LRGDTERETGFGVETELQSQIVGISQALAILDGALILH